MTRRTALSALGASALLAREARPQAAAEKDGGPKAGAAKGPRITPLVCAYSGNLAKVPYSELGLVAAQIGYDGVDLTMMPGGHVEPRIANVDVVRAIESVRGAALEVPMIATVITSTADPTAYPVLAITGHTQVHLFRTGYWPWGNSPDIQRRMAEVRNDLLGLVRMGQSSQMIAMIPNRAGAFVGEAVWDMQAIINSMDPAWIGYCFDPSQTQNWEPALRLALPRLRSVAVQDFYWEKSGKTWARKMCPMGEGMVDWPLFFRILAQANFSGPLSLHFEYTQPDAFGAMSKDIEFVRGQIKQAWPSAGN